MRPLLLSVMWRYLVEVVGVGGVLEVAVLVDRGPVDVRAVDEALHGLRRVQHDGPLARTDQVA